MTLDQFHLWIKATAAVLLFGLLLHAVWKQDWPQAIFWALALNAGPGMRR